MNKKQRQQHAKKAMINVLKGAQYEFLYEELPEAEAEKVWDEIESMIAEMEKAFRLQHVSSDINRPLVR